MVSLFFFSQFARYWIFVVEKGYVFIGQHPQSALVPFSSMVDPCIIILFDSILFETYLPSDLLAFYSFSGGLDPFSGVVLDTGESSLVLGGLPRNSATFILLVSNAFFTKAAISINKPMV